MGKEQFTMRWRKELANVENLKAGKRQKGLKEVKNKILK